MNKEQADIKAGVLNKLAKHPDISYQAQEMQPTKWEKPRFGVHLCYKDSPVGIAAT